MNNELPSRKDKKYILIESFNFYELTHCIAYEMAMRNKNVINFINILDELTSLHKKLTLNSLKNPIIFTISPWYDEVYNILFKYEKIEYWYHTLKEIEEITYNLIMLIITKIIFVLENNYYVVHERSTIVPKDMKEIFNNITNHEPDCILDEHIEKVLNNGKYYKDNYSLNDGYVVYQGGYEGDNIFNCFKIKPNFKKPLRQFNQTEISLNISLPKDEILAYIGKIKDDYDSKDSSIKNVLEFLGKELNLDIEDYKNMTAKKWADFFYIYDCKTTYKIKNLNEKIQKELTIHNGVSVLVIEKNLNKNGKEKVKREYELIPFEDYVKSNPNFDFEDLADLADEKHCYSTKVIRDNHLKLMKRLIEGEEPKYKTLIIR